MSTRYRHPVLAAMSGLLVVLPPRRARRWSALSLALAALLMSWDDGPTLLDRFMSARALLGRRCGGTYQGFAKALARHGAGLVRTLRLHLAGLIRGHPDLWTIEGWMLFAIDASRFDLPRTLANDTVLGVPSRRGSLPQILATMLVHLGSGVVWDWRLTHCNAGERRGMLAMLASLPRGALLVADAGFVGHECLGAVVKSGRHVLVRLAGNAVLTTGLTRRADIVALWPRGRGEARGAPLVLRVVRVRDRKGGEVVLGTSVLDKQRLSDAQAAVFYRLRWGVEVCYRSLKQTLRRRKLLSASPARAVRELHWVMLGMMVLGLLTLTRLSPRLDRRRWSVAAAARAVRHAARARTGAVARRHLSTLRGAVCGDNRRADKQAWEWPHKKNPKPPGPPILRRATRAEVARWRSFSRRRA